MQQYYEEMPSEWLEKPIEELEELRDQIYTRLEILPEEHNDNIRNNYINYLFMLESYIDYRYNNQ